MYFEKNLKEQGKHVGCSEHIFNPNSITAYHSNVTLHALASIFRNWKLLLASITLLVSFGYVVPHGSRIAEPSRTEWVQYQQVFTQHKPLDAQPTSVAYRKFQQVLRQHDTRIQLALKNQPFSRPPTVQRKTTTSTSTEEDLISILPLA